MELRHLRCFRAVAEELSFVRAAEKLHIEQSPLPRAVKSLSIKATSVPSGAVTLTGNGAPRGSVTLANGTASFSTCTLSAGVHTIVATYGEDPQNAGASMRFTQSVGAATVNPVPTLSQWGLVLLGSVLAMFGVPALRRKGGQR